MINRFKKWFYSFFIISVKFVTKKRASDFTCDVSFASVNVTSKDDKNITFTFKTEKRQHVNSLFLKYAVGCQVDETFSKELQELNTKVLISVTLMKVGFLRPNYKILANILLELYIKAAAAYLEDLKKKST